MKALRLTDHGLLLDPHYPSPSLQPGEALIDVRVAGICATDMALMAGYKGGYRGVLGHEFTGQVIAAPDAPEWVGRRVVGEINIGCGSCSICRRGLGKHCRGRKTLGIIDKDGAFAEMITLPVSNLHEIPATVGDEEAVFVEPLAAALEILEQVHLEPSTRIYQFGSGKLGMLIAQVLVLTGCDLTVVGRHPPYLEMLKMWHRCHVVESGSAEEQQLANEPADIVVEATGSPQGLASALGSVRPGGTVVLKSTFAGESGLHSLNQLVVDEVTIVGSRCGPFAPALRLLESKKVQVLPLIQGSYPLQESLAAFDHAARRGVLKILVRP